MPILWESLVLALICALDLVTTLGLMASGTAGEANPILRFYLQNGGEVCFAAAKVLLFLGPIFVLEVFRRRRPRFVQSVLRAGILLYILSYGVGVWYANVAPAGAMPVGQPGWTSEP